MYDFNIVHDRKGSGCVKWDKQGGFGVKNGLLPFWIADSDFATLPEITQAIVKRLEHPIVGYSDVYEECVDAISGWYERRHGYKIPTSAMLLGSGVVTSIRFTINALTEKNDKVMIFSPIYDPFFKIIENSDRTVVDCQLVLTEGKYTIDFEKMELNLREGVKVVLLCNPHNPVGRVWTYKELEKIANLCEKYDAYLLSDEIHGDILLYGNKYTTMCKFENIKNKLIVYTAISKTFNMAGLISSCMFIPNTALMYKIDSELSKAWIFGPNALSYSAITAAYTYGDTWVDEQNNYLTQNAEYVINYAKEHMPLLNVIKPEATFLMWIDFTTLKMSSKEICKVMASKYGIALSDGFHYGSQADGFMRLNIGCSRSTLKEGIDLIHKFYNYILGGKNDG